MFPYFDKYLDTDYLVERIEYVMNLMNGSDKSDTTGTVPCKYAGAEQGV